MNTIQQLLKKLNKIEKQLEKVRGASPLSDGWQTKKLANKQRKWDELSKEKFEIINQLNKLNYEYNINRN